MSSFSLNNLFRNRNFAAILTACAPLTLALEDAGLHAQAAPITIAFDATVTDVPTDFPALNLPFTLSPGQKFTGEYSFASAQDMHDVFLPSYPDGLGKSGNVTVTIGSEVGAAFVNFGEFSDGALVNPAEPIFPARLILSYFSPTNVMPPWRGGIANNRMNTELILSGSYGSFASESDLFDPAAWNRLVSQREFDLQFVYYVESDFHYVTVKSEVGDFREVPEPTTLLLSWLCAGYCASHRGRKGVRNA